MDPEYRSPTPQECYQTLLSDHKRGEFDRLPGASPTHKSKRSGHPAPDNGVRYLPPVYTNDPPAGHQSQSHSRSVFNKCRVTRDMDYYGQLKAADDDIVKWGYVQRCARMVIISLHSCILYVCVG